VADKSPECRKAFLKAEREIDKKAKENGDNSLIQAAVETYKKNSNGDGPSQLLIMSILQQHDMGNDINRIDTRLTGVEINVQSMMIKDVEQDNRHHGCRKEVLAVLEEHKSQIGSISRKIGYGGVILGAITAVVPLLIVGSQILLTVIGG